MKSSCPRWFPIVLLLTAFLFAVFSFRPATVAAEQSCSAQKGLVILVDFPDIPRPIQLQTVQERFQRLGAYVQEMSYGQVCPSLDYTGWHRLPQSISQYRISPANLDVDKARVVKLIQNAVDAAETSVDFSKYSFFVVFMAASFHDYGMVGLCGYPGMLGWNQETMFKTQRGQIIPGGVAIFTSTAHLGTLFHDIAHIWGGVKDGKRQVPCLYDHDIQARYPTRDTGFANSLINMGYWDPMSCHVYKMHLPPPGISSWTKLRLGWLPTDKVAVVDRTKPQELTLAPLEDGSAAPLAIKIPLTPSSYYLIENRQPLGRFDPHLPGHGVLILFADDNVAECRHGRSPVKMMNANPSVPHLQGAAFSLPGNSVFRDEANNLEIRLVERVGHSYRLRIDKIRP